MKTKNVSIAILFLFLTYFSQDQNENKIWFDHTSTSWNEALPIGNDRLGTMIFGGINEERVQLNKESI